jgi:anti-sigma factor RsiW
VALGVLLAEPLLRDRSSTPALVRSVAAQQAALADGRLPLEVRSEVSGDVAAWLRPRVGFPVELPATTAGGVEVVGARLTELAASEAAAVVYRVDGRPVTLFTFPAATLRASTNGARTVTVGEEGHRFHLYRLGGLTVTLWSRGAAGYALAAPADVAASHGCAVCHVGDEGPRLERALGAGLAPR